MAGDSGRGAELARLLLGGFRLMVEEVQVELARRGHPGVRPAHEFALSAVADGAGSTSEVARHLGVTKQSAAKTVASLLERGYLEQGADDRDGRRKLLRVTAQGADLLVVGRELFDEVRARWAVRIGHETLETFEAGLGDLLGPGSLRSDTAGWFTGPG